MKWVGWIVAILLVGILCLAQYLGQQHLATKRGATERQLSSKRAGVEATLKRLANDHAGTDERIQAEAARTADLARQQRDLQQRQEHLTVRLRELMAATDEARRANAELKSPQGNPQTDIREMRERVVVLEEHVRVLRQALTMVTTKAER